MALNLATAWKQYGHIPLTDPTGYVDLARQSHLFFDTTPREPLHIFFVKLALPVFQQPETALRVLTLGFTFISFVIICLWGRLTIGLWPAVVAGLSFASSSLVSYYSVQGFNIVTYVCFLLLFVAIWDSVPYQPSPQPLSLHKSQIWPLGIVAGLTSLTRLEGLLVTGLCLMTDGLVGLRKNGGRGIRQALGAMLIAFLMVAPYLVHQKLTHGSFLYSHHVHAAFWANRETIANSRFKTEGLPLRQEPMGLLQFFTKEGTWQSAQKFLKGYWLAATWYTPRLFQGTPWEWLLVPLGLVAAVLTQRWKILLLWAASILPVAFILPVDAVGPHSGVELRFLLPAIPCLAYFSGLGAGWLLDNAKGFRTPNST